MASRDSRKTKAQLIEELNGLRKQIKKLEKSSPGSDSSSVYTENISNLSNDMMGIVGFDNRFKEVNPAFTKTLGWSKKELLKKQLPEIVHPEDHEKVGKMHVQEIQAGKTVTNFECRMMCKDGTHRWLSWNISPIAGQEASLGVSRDITEAKIAFEALEESEEKYRRLVEMSPDAIIVAGLDTKIIMVNQKGLEIYRAQHEEDLVGKTGLELLEPEDRKQAIKQMAETIKDNTVRSMEYNITRKDGTSFPAEINVSNITNPQGEPLYFLTIIRDITDTKKARDELMLSEKRFRRLFEYSPISIWEEDFSEVKDYIDSLDLQDDGDFEQYLENNPEFLEECMKRVKLLDVNQASLKLHRAKEKDELLKGLAQIFNHKSLNALKKGLVAIKNGITLFETESVVQTLDGASRIVSLHWMVPPGYESNYARVILSSVDITEIKQAQEALQESELQYRTTIDSMSSMIHVVDTDLKIQIFNKAFARKNEELGLNPYPLGRNIFKVFPFLEPKIRDEYKRVFKTGEPIISEEKVKIGDEVLNTDTRKIPIFEKGKVVRVLTEVRDITESKLADDALKETTAFLEEIFANVGEGVIVYDKDFRYLVWNDFMERLSGIERQNVLGKIAFDIFPHLKEQGVDKLLERALAGETVQSGDVPYRIPQSNKQGWVSGTYCPHYNSDGKIIGVVGTVHEITERKIAEEESQKLEKKLMEAQKLESLGVLAGGIAHDFNNLLMGILGNADLALLELSPASPVRNRINSISNTAIRAAELCNQMLAYSGKGRFVVEPIDLSTLVEEMTHLLNTSLSKSTTLNMRLGSDLPAISADATQIRQVVMNLIINASEAIGDTGGSISVVTDVMECSEDYLKGVYIDDKLSAGTYAYIEVSDTGDGMDEATISRVFEPFFTTKFTGRGLGLAAVLGIVRGHDGAVKVYSEPGKGTTFKVLFPACKDAVIVKRTKETSSDEWSGQGTVLLVDDDQVVIDVGTEMLKKMGLDVITANNGNDAVRIFCEHMDKIRLVILDMTMPEMSGEETFREIRTIKKDAVVLLSSGYNEQDVTQRFVGKGLAGFIQKPYQTTTLATKMKEILG